MAENEDIREWADREKLSSDIVDMLLDELGFDTLETLRLLTIDEVTESIQKPKLLPLAKCLKLKKALESLSGPTESDHPTSSAKAVTFSTETQTEGYESEVSWQTMKPQPDHLGRAREVFKGVKEGVLHIFGGEPEEEEHFRFLLLGKTGSGKSSTGNTILGEKLFRSDVTFGSVTEDCELKSSRKDGRLIDIMDSPGLYDTSKTPGEINTIIVRAVACMHPGPHAILYVVKMARYTDEEYGVYNRLKDLFDENITKYIIVLVTGGDEIEDAGKTLADVLKSAPAKLTQVIEDCNHRCVVFNNKAKDTKPQVDRLLEQVRKMNVENKSPYACPKYASVGQGLEAEVERRLAEVNNGDVEREQYVKNLEERKARAEEELRRTKEDFRRREQEREKELQEERERLEREKEELRDKLKKKEKEAEIQEETKKSAANDEDREEEEKIAEALARQGELRQSILRREMEQEKLLKRLEEDRKREREEIRRREQEREELERKGREEERKENERQRRAYEEEMRRMKEQIAENKEQGWVEWATKSVSKWFERWK